jgi:GT2 family glycosyltransferase
MRTTVITVVHGRHEHLARQHEALLRSLVRPYRYLVVAMDDDGIADWTPAGEVPPEVLHVDGRPDGLPLAAARNAGARAATAGGADLLVFLDVDCMPDPDLVGGYVRSAVRCTGHLLCGPVTYLPEPGRDGYPYDGLTGLRDPHPARPAPDPGQVVVDRDGHDLFWSLSFALTPATWDAIGGFDEAYVGYGGEDTDFGRRAAASGIPLAWVGDAHAYHQHHPVSRPPVEHLEDIVRNAGLFHDRWGDWPMTGWLDELAGLGLVERVHDRYVVAASRRSST